MTLREALLAGRTVVIDYRPELPCVVQPFKEARCVVIGPKAGINTRFSKMGIHSTLYFSGQPHRVCIPWFAVTRWRLLQGAPSTGGPRAAS